MKQNDDLLDGDFERLNYRERRMKTLSQLPVPDYDLDWRRFDTSVSAELRAYARKLHRVRLMNRRQRILFDIKNSFSNAIAKVRSYFISRGIGHI